MLPRRLFIDRFILPGVKFYSSVSAVGPSKGSPEEVLIEKTRKAQQSWSPIQLSALSSSLVQLNEDQYQVMASL